MYIIIVLYQFHRNHPNPDGSRPCHPAHFHKSKKDLLLSNLISRSHYRRCHIRLRPNERGATRRSQDNKRKQHRRYNVQVRHYASRPGY